MLSAVKPLTPATLKLLGALNVVFGLCAVGLCGASLAMLVLHGLLLADANEAGAANPTFAEFHRFLSSLWILYMPLGALLGALFALSGWWLVRCERRGKTASVCAVVGLATWFVGYSGSVLSGREELAELMFGGVIGQGTLSALLLVGLAQLAVVLFAYPAVLLVLLRRPFPAAEPRGGTAALS